ncbi:MAG TPA: rhodanese-like domain-containing protein [Syntrophorhabdaceae bacterium]|nr:rhodanese-like domain-containing protein [Syntrophorhabdaceae bacterium]
MKKMFFCFFVFSMILISSEIVLAENTNLSIVSAEWLYKNLQNESVFVLDIRKVEDYKEGHIPGALSLTYAAWRTTDNNLSCQLPHKDELTDTVCYSGMRADTHVIIVGNTDTYQQRINATRVAWTLKYAGIKRPSILDGGFKKWARYNYPISTEWVKRQRSKYRCQFNENVVTSKRVLESHLKDVAIIDVRPERLYKGLIEDPMLKRKGHIPGAINLPYTLVFKQDGTFEDREKLESIATKALGNSKDREIVALCCTGQFASSWWFVLSEVLGYKNAKIYDGSMEEWCGDKNAPLVDETGK